MFRLLCGEFPYSERELPEADFHSVNQLLKIEMPSLISDTKSVFLFSFYSIFSCQKLCYQQWWCLYQYLNISKFFCLINIRLLKSCEETTIRTRKREGIKIKWLCYELRVYLERGENLSSIFLSRLITITSMMSNDWSFVEILCNHQHVMTVRRSNKGKLIVIIIVIYFIL